MSFISKKLKEFDERYPEFNGIGASHPIFQENPNPNHIKQFLTQCLTEFADKIRLEVSHSEFCKKDGKQFKECARCYLDRKIDELLNVEAKADLDKRIEEMLGR